MGQTTLEYLMKALLFIFLVISSVAQAQEQLAVRLNEKGLMNILHMAVKYNTNSASSKTIIIPTNVYKFTVKQKQLASNPIVAVVNEISNLNLNKNLDFYLQTSDIKVSGVVDQRSLKASISNSGPNGFDVKITVSLPSVSVTGANLSLCEDKVKNQKKCGNGLKMSVASLKVNTKTTAVVLSANMRVSIKNNAASVKVLSVSSNIDTPKGPKLDINFASLTVPKITIVINGQETELDTSKLKDEILERKAFLANKLIGFVGDFVASDLAEMINVYLKNTKLPTTYEVFRQEESDIAFDELDYSERYKPAAIDNTYVRPPVMMVPRTSTGKLPKMDIKGPGEIMEEQISEIIRSAVISLALKSISTPLNKDIQLSGALSMVLNNQTIRVQNRLSNRDVSALPKIDLSGFRAHDINLAISEPVINGALDLVGKTGLFQELFETFGRVKGFSLSSVQMHFAKDKSLRGIVNAQIDLNQVDSNGFGGWIKNQWAAYRERNNNNGKIYFPIEVSIIPAVVTQKNGEIALSLYVRSPFNGDTLINNFGYPSNIANMKSEVKKGVIAELKKALGEHVNKAYVLDVTKFMNQAGVVFKPKSISFEQGAYMLVNLDIADIKFNSKNPTKK
jgi:hypothetical protein